MNEVLYLIGAIILTAAITMLITRQLLTRRMLSGPETTQPPVTDQDHFVVSNAAGTPEVQILAESEESPLPAVRVDSWALDSEDDRLLVIHRSYPSGSGTPLPEKLTTAISPIVERLPSLASDTKGMAKDCYKIVFKPEITKGLRSGTLELMRSDEVAGGFRLNAINKSGKVVVGQGSVVRVGKALRVATAGFQVASFVAGQAHLAQINERLKAIESKVDDVLNFLRDTRSGRLSGSIQYFRNQISYALVDNLHQLDVVALNDRVEAAEHWCLGMIITAKGELERYEQDVRTLRLNRWLKTAKTDERQLRKKRDQCFDAARVLLMALEVRVLANELKATLLMDYGLTIKRRDECQRGLTEAMERLKRLAGLLNNRSVELRGAFRRRKALKSLKKTIIMGTGNQLTASIKQCNSMQETLRSGIQFEGDRNQLLSTGVCIEVTRGEDGSWRGRQLTE